MSHHALAESVDFWWFVQSLLSPKSQETTKQIPNVSYCRLHGFFRDQATVYLVQKTLKPHGEWSLWVSFSCLCSSIITLKKTFKIWIGNCSKWVRNIRNMRHIFESTVMKNMVDDAFNRCDISSHLACGELTRKTRAKVDIEWMRCKSTNLDSILQHNLT